MQMGSTPTVAQNYIYKIMMVSDFVRIAAAGGGLHLDCSKYMVSDIVRIAAAASQHKAAIILANCSRLMASDAVRIAAAGKGSVIFYDLQ